MSYQIGVLLVDGHFLRTLHSWTSNGVLTGFELPYVAGYSS